MLLDFLRPKMDVSDDEVFSVYPGKSNNPGDIIKGRTFRRLNVTRKITIKDVPGLLTTALNMQTFALGQRYIRQCRGSPMGSPLSPALCLMVVSISEQRWSINFKQILSKHHLFIKHIRYVHNRLISETLDFSSFPHTKSFSTKASMENPSSSKLNQTKNFSLKPNLWNSSTRDISQVLSPYCASPPKVLLSGFRSRCHIAVKGAFPEFRVRQGLDQLIHLYILAGFPNEELQTISTQILTQHQNLQPQENRASLFRLFFHLLGLFSFVGSLVASCFLLCLF